MGEVRERLLRNLDNALADMRHAHSLITSYDTKHANLALDYLNNAIHRLEWWRRDLRQGDGTDPSR